MAVTKTMESRSLQRKEIVSIDENGKETIDCKTVSNINKNLTDEDFVMLDTLIGKLSENNSHRLYEKISNKLEA